jgi:hypothetical protein
VGGDLASFPRDPWGSPIGAAGAHRRLLEDLVAHGAIRINCGGTALGSADGKEWSRDGFFLGGSSHNHGKTPEGKAHPVEDGDEGHDPLRAGFAVPDVRSFQVMIEDGALDVDFVAHRDHPLIAALEVETVD